MNQWIKKLCVIGLVLCPLSYAQDVPRTSCAGDVPCLCPDGSRPLGGCTRSCESACGLNSGGGSSGGSGNTLEGQILLQGAAILGNAIGQALRGNPQEDAARQAAAAARAAEQKRQVEEAAAEHKRQEEETKQRLLGSMKGIDSTSQLGLMGVDTAPDLQLMTDDQSASASNSPAKTNENNNSTQAQPKSTAFTKGYDDASQCYSQNSGPRCSGLAANEQQTCIADYRAGYQVGDKERQLLMQQAWQAGKLAAAKGDLANGASDPLADGPCRVEWIQTYNKGYFQGKPAPLRETKPAIAATAKVNSEDARIINGMNALAKQLGWSADEQARLNEALNKLGGDGDPASSAQISQAWDSVLARGHGGDLAREAAQGEGPGFPGSGKQTGYQDCAIFALANASGQPYGVVAARAAKLIGEGEWRNAAERANPQKTIERKGLIGGEVVMLTEALGQAEVVASTDFAKTLKGGRPVMVNVVPENGDVKSGHEVVLTKAFQHGGETWYEMMDSNQGPQRRLYLSAKELNTILQEKGVAFRPDSGTTPRLLRANGGN